MIDKCSQTDEVSSTPSISSASGVANSDKEQTLRLQSASTQDIQLISLTEEEILLCTVCNDMFQSQQQLDDHLQEFHGAPGELSKDIVVNANRDATNFNDEPIQIMSNKSQPSFNPNSTSNL